MAEGINVRLPNQIKNFVDEQSGPDGIFGSASEYIRDLIRKDYEHHEEMKWQRLESELRLAMSANKENIEDFDPESIIKEAKTKKVASE